MLDGAVDEAAKFHVSVFPDSEIKSDKPMSATIVANGTEMLMFNGGRHFKFSRDQDRRGNGRGCPG